MNLNTFCPGVYTSVKKTSSGNGFGAVCIAAKAQNGNTGEAVTLYSKSAAISVFSDPTDAAVLSAMVSAAFDNGAKKVYAVNCQAASDYLAAFEIFSSFEDATVIVCDSSDQAVLSALNTSVDTSVERGYERFAVISVEADNISLERGMRSVFVSQTSETLGVTSKHITAAAISGLICKGVYSNKNVNRSSFSGITLTDSITQVTADSLLSSGITPVGVMGSCSVSRCICSFTDNGIKDIYSVIACDKVIRGARGVLTDLFESAVSPTYSAIESKLIVFLEKAVDMGLISQYERPILTPNTTDATICDILLSFTSAVGINQIRLFAEVSI
ncbi:MAG: hypothetical protein IJ462_03760 [Clostridia bacterium]|nr:hypothetical protein [Clostridia bacterium]